MRPGSARLGFAAVAAVCVSLVSVSQIIGCGGAPPGVDDSQATTIALQTLPFASLEIPDHNRPTDAPIPTVVSLPGPWNYAGATGQQMHKYTTEIPIRPRGLFFHSPQPGMALTDRDGKALDYDRFGKADQPFWSHNQDKIIVYLPDKGTPPQAGHYQFTYPRAVEREAALNYKLSGAASPEDFVWTEVHHKWETRRGLLLPAPGTASWAFTVPAAGELLYTPGLVAPEVLDGAPSDGATLVIEVEVGGVTHPVATEALKVGSYERSRADLSAWAGQEAVLRFRTEPGETSRFDYAFIGEPIVASRKSNPRQVVLIFVDTLRPDHMSLFGYHRDTSKSIDDWADGAVVFENARSVAPWTLPSARSVLTGAQPEAYENTPTLPGRLAEKGFATAMIAGNVYLSTNFGMARDWGLHTVGMWPQADEVTDDALAFLEANAGHDVLLQVHYMDAHLPYVEPKAYRFMYAGDSQGGLREEFHLSDVKRANTKPPEVRQYIQDRYDNNIRYATDQIARILATLDDNDIVVFYADHGEEFWDHTGFEHGHQLFDELLRVPLVIKAPGFTGSRIDAPVSLLDVTPTVLDLLDIEAEGLAGTSLVGAMRGDSAALETLSSRDIAFGRPLYGSERWGVLHGDEKWTTSEGREALYDLGTDATEQTNLIANKDGTYGEKYRGYFAEALGAELGIGYRLHGGANRGSPPADDMVVAMTVPGGVKAAWVGPDPLAKSKANVWVQPAGDRDIVVATWERNYRGEAIIWVVPKEPLEEVTHGITLCGEMGDAVRTAIIPATKPAGLAAHRVPLTRLQFPSRMTALTVGIAPIPDPDEQAVTGNDPEIGEMLQAMGYAVADMPEAEDVAAAPFDLSALLERCETVDPSMTMKLGP